MTVLDHDLSFLKILHAHFVDRWNQRFGTWIMKSEHKEGKSREISPPPPFLLWFY
jgi:hypothetical protein